MKQSPFDWDDDKAAANLKKHGVAFEEAAAMLDNSLSAVFPDPRHYPGEKRWIGIGYSHLGRVVVAGCTFRGEVTRIINVRKATKSEIKKYEERNRNRN